MGSGQLTLYRYGNEWRMAGDSERFFIVFENGKTFIQYFQKHLGIVGRAYLATCNSYERNCPLIVGAVQYALSIHMFLEVVRKDYWRNFLGSALVGVYVSPWRLSSDTDI